jgi:hypothetical protein
MNERTLLYQDKYEHLIYFLKFINILSQKNKVNVYFKNKNYEEEIVDLIKYNYYSPNNIDFLDSQPKTYDLIDLKRLENNYAFSNIIYKFFEIIDESTTDYDFNIQALNRDLNIDKLYKVLHFNENNDINFNFERIFNGDYNDILGANFKSSNFIFIGELDIYEKIEGFIKENVADIKYYESTKNLLDIVKIISKSEMFIGNPILYLSIAQELSIDAITIISSNQVLYKDSNTLCLNV